MSRKILFLLIIWIFPVFAQVFLPGTEDIPLMDGLKNVEETASFDNPSERLLLVSAETTIPSKKILSFYQQNLQNLGWNRKTDTLFYRGDDSFSIEINSNRGVNQIQFRLKQVNP